MMMDEWQKLSHYRLCLLTGTRYYDRLSPEAKERVLREVAECLRIDRIYRQFCGMNPADHPKN